MIYPGFSSLCAFSIRSTCTAYAAAALRQLQQEHGLRREISDMVHHEGMAVEPTVRLLMPSSRSFYQSGKLVTKKCFKLSTTCFFF